MAFKSLMNECGVHADKEHETFLRFMSEKNVELVLNEGKASTRDVLIEDLREKRQEILKSVDKKCASIIAIRQDAIQKFAMIEAAPAEKKDGAVLAYRAAFKNYYDQCGTWQHAIADYKSYYEQCLPKIKEQKKTVWLFSLFNSLGKTRDPHEMFLRQMKEKQNSLEAALLKLDAPKQNLASVVKKWRQLA